LIDVPEHKLASSISAETGDVNFDFGHVETQFRVLSKQLANLDQHLEGCLESGINVRIICESKPASTTHRSARGEDIQVQSRHRWRANTI
jgi:hypothetical protein